jgi:hypothetical protein
MLPARLRNWLNGPLHILKTRQNVVIIQLYPKQRVVSVSYKGDIKKGHFADNSIKSMLKGGMEFQENAEQVLGAVGKLLEQLTNKQ